MTTHPTESPPAPAPAATQPATVAAPPDLETRIEARKQHLLATLGKLKAEAGDEAAKASDKIKAKLSQLSHIVKEGVVDGWANLGDIARTKLEHWLA